MKTHKKPIAKIIFSDLRVHYQTDRRKALSYRCGVMTEAPKEETGNG